METNHRILVVCGDPGMLDQVGNYLCEQGYDVQCASSGQESRAIYAGWAAELVICDYQVSDAHGLDLIESIRRLNPRARFILIIPPGETPEFMRATRSRIVAFLGKPFKPEDLMYYVRGAFSLSETGYNRREFSRYCLGIETQCFLINPFSDTERPAAGLLRDVSRSGVSMIVRQVMPVPAMMKLVFRTPDQRSFSMLAKSVSCTLTQISGVYRLGARFIGLLPLELERTFRQFGGKGDLGGPDEDIFMGKSFKDAIVEWISAHKDEFPDQQTDLTGLAISGIAEELDRDLRDGPPPPLG